MEQTKTYEELFTRNSGYVSEELQNTIRQTKVLIAGCGIGSSIAEALVRIGFEHLVLADLDTVAVHNLNRQLYTYADIGSLKTEALAKRLLAINPHVSIKSYNDGVTKENVKEMVNTVDIIFDTIDFLSLSTIVAVHDEAHLQRKPIMSALSAGFGAMAIYFPGVSEHDYCEFRKLFGLELYGEVSDESYVTHFKAFIQKINDELDPLVASVMAKSLTIMEDGKPCPASQVSAGSFAIGSLAVTMVLRILNHETVSQSPHLLSVAMPDVCQSMGIDLARAL